MLHKSTPNFLFLGLYSAIFLIALPLIGGVEPVTAQPPQAPPPFNVKVINAPSEPVPVSGTVNVGNLGSSPLPVNGTVSVENSGGNPLLVRDVNNPAKALFSLSVAGAMQPGQSSASFKKLNLAPAGKRLLVEYVTAQCYMVPGRRPLLQLLALDSNGNDIGEAGGMSFHIFHFQGNTQIDGFDVYNASELVRLPTPAAGGIEFRLRQTGAADVLSACRISLSGNIVTDAP